MSSSPSSLSSSEREPPPLGSLGWVMDVPCPVDFILGTTTVKVRECVKFAPQSIVRLKQAAGADLEVRVAGVPVAAGEVLIVDEAVSLRLSKILPPAGAETV